MKKSTEKVITGVKAFNKGMTCKGFQYEEGKTYETDEKPVRCTKNGFHFCTEPLDVLRYYYPSDSVFHLVEGFGEADTDNKDSKIAVSKIKIGARVGIGEFCKLAIEAVFKRRGVKRVSNSGDRGLASNSGYRGLASNLGYRGLASNSGNYGLASNSGDYGLASNSGDRGLASNSGYNGLASNSGDYGLASNSGYSGLASNSGDYGLASNSGDSGLASNSGNYGLASNSGYSGLASNSGNYGLASNSGDRGLASNSGYGGLAETSGRDSLAVAFGVDSKARASLNSYITLSELEYCDNEWILKTVKTAKIDGKKLKADTWYKLQGGKFIVAE